MGFTTNPKGSTDVPIASNGMISTIQPAAVSPDNTAQCEAIMSIDKNDARPIEVGGNPATMHLVLSYSTPGADKVWHYKTTGFFARGQFVVLDEQLD